MTLYSHYLIYLDSSLFKFLSFKSSKVSIYEYIYIYMYMYMQLMESDDSAYECSNICKC